MLKYIGLFTLFLSALSVGVYFSSKIKNQLKAYEDIIKLLNHTKTEILFFNTTIDEIFNSYTPCTKTAKFLINSSKETAVLDLISQKEELYLGESTCILLTDLLTRLGKTNRTELLSVIEHHMSAIEQEYNELKKKAPERIKLYTALSLYGGIMVILFFI